MIRNSLCAILLALAAAGGAAAQGPLDLIPADALGGVAIRDLNDLKKKGDQFIKDTELKFPLRPSELFDQVYQFLGVQGAVDQDGSAAIVLANPKAVGAELNFGTLDKYIVVALPFADRDRIGESMGLKKGELKADKLTETRTGKPFAKFCYARGKTLFLGGHDKAVESVARARGLGGELTAAQRKGFGGADIFLHLGTEAWGEMWKSFLREADQALAGRGEEAERKVVQEFLRALGSVRFGLGAIRIDGGLGVNLVTVFPKDGGEAAKKFLTTLRAGDGASDLKGLPEGRVVAAQAARGDGTQNELLARVFFQFLLEGFLEANKVVSPADRPVFVGIFSEVWRHLRASRFAVYQTADEQKLGLFSLVGILDTEDADKFLEQMRQLARLGDPDALDLKTEAGREATRAELEKLIRDLGSRRFAVREAASTRLALVGEPALPHLEKALKSPDPEVAKRADNLMRDILGAAEARRKELLGKDLTRGVRPTFAFLPKGEEVDGHKVAVVAVKVSKRDAAAVPQLRQLLGPEWNRVRLAVRGKQVVVLVGSDVKLLGAALKNLKEGAPGLAASAALKEFGRRTDPARKIEFHASLQAAVGLIRAADLDKPGAIKAGESLSSVALTVEPDRLELSFWLPSAEFKVVARANGL